ncbi:hypothetical protein TARUN_8894 [Trichoderma arundinaceum]|uniref:Uncharacterized protein n=1 Tax=Trichoderma arundinaceum TaxID=490622 RepID=A0A395NB91_TRIAR|nr:hypothetical protein TARUN_8894 [Trichoderma arundinaceum]
MLRHLLRVPPQGHPPSPWDVAEHMHSKALFLAPYSLRALYGGLSPSIAASSQNGSPKAALVAPEATEEGAGGGGLTSRPKKNHPDDEPRNSGEQVALAVLQADVGEMDSPDVPQTDKTPPTVG